jgi:hypothetical protein
MATARRPKPGADLARQRRGYGLTIFADVKTGHNCYPGAKKCADKLRVSVDTIQRGWAELVEAGWLELMPLPAVRRPEQGALKVPR